MVLEIEVTREEIKKAVWDCGVDKSPTMIGFTYWLLSSILDFSGNRRVEEVYTSSNHGTFPKDNTPSSFYHSNAKTQEAKMMKDFSDLSTLNWKFIQEYCQDFATVWWLFWNDGTYLMGFITEDGQLVDIQFWEDKRRGDNTFSIMNFPRIMHFGVYPKIYFMALKLSHVISVSFRRAPRAELDDLEIYSAEEDYGGFTLFDSKVNEMGPFIRVLVQLTVACVRTLLTQTLYQLLFQNP
ncbi:hypothetical protein Tco_1368295 [Tanacetum coccineum]